MIRLAIEADWPLIERWRADHFAEIARRGSTRAVEGQRGLSDAVWVVVEYDGLPVAATSFLDHGDTRFAHDLYAAEGHVIDGLRLGKWLEGECDRLGLELRATTDPENVEYIRLLERRGFERTSVELRRRPKA